MFFYGSSFSQPDFVHHPPMPDISGGDVLDGLLENDSVDEKEDTNISHLSTKLRALEAKRSDRSEELS